MESEVDLVIKTPNLDVGDQQYKCSLNWTVKTLKNYLSNVYPTKPAVESQRLIYFGQILSDDLMLKDVFMNEWEVQTIHMMCPPRKNFSNGASVSNSKSSKAPINSRSTNSNNSNSGIYQNLQTDLGNTSQMPNYFQGFPLNPIYDNQQMMMMQQAYAQYMMQYFQYLQSNSPSTNTVSNEEISSQPIVNNTSEIPPEQNADDAQNNQENEINEDPLANRDIIDVTYILIRASILISILYFYSSFSRCIFVIGISFFIYVYRRGFFTIRRERIRNDRRQQTQSRRNVIRNRRRIRTSSESNYSQQGTQNTQVSNVKTFIAAFFTSLIPEQLNPVEMN